MDIGTISAWKEGLDIGRGCPGSPHPWRWHWAQLGLSDPGGLFPPQEFHFSVEEQLLKEMGNQLDVEHQLREVRTSLTPVHHPKNDIFPACVCQADLWSWDSHSSVVLGFWKR